MRKLAYIFCVALFLFGRATLEDMQKRVRQNPISSAQMAATDTARPNLINFLMGSSALNMQC